MTEIFDVICIGAALVDMIARVERHPLEDDEVFVSDLKLLSGGAAANTAYACGKLGLLTAFIGKLGNKDTFGMKILNDFNEVKVSTLVKFSKKYGTGSAYVALNESGDRRIYAHSGAANYLSGEDIKEGDLEPTKTIFLSSLKNLEPFIKAAKIGKKNKTPVILNPGMLIIDQGLENITELLENVDIFILSQREFKTLLNLGEQDLSNELIKEHIGILQKLSIKVIIITMGEKGAFLLSEKDSEMILTVTINKVVDTTGAGDAFSAGFIFGFSQNLSFEFADLMRNVKIGNFVAGNCIQELGARNGIPTQEEIQKLFD